MTKTFSATILLLLTTLIGLSQPIPPSAKTIDSLTRIIATQPNDTSRAFNLHLLSSMVMLINTDQALKYANEGYLLSQKIGYNKGELSNLENIVFIDAIKGEWIKGTELCYSGIKLSEKYGKPEEELIFYNTLSIILKKQDENSKSLELLLNIKKSPLFEKSDIINVRWSTLQELGEAYANVGQWDSAFYYARASYDLAVKNNFTFFEATSLFILGIVEEGKGNFKEALNFFHQAIEIDKRYDRFFTISERQFEMAKVFAKMNQRDSAIQYANIAFDSAKVYQNLLLIKDASAFLAKEYENTDIQKAYSYLSISNQAKDSLMNSAKIRQLQQLEVKEQQRIDDLNSAKLAYQNKIRQNTLLGLSGTLVIFLAFFWRNNRIKQKTNVVLKTQKDEILGALTQLKSTQAQLIQSEKMASLGELTAGIAHEIQNPLNFVNNFSEVNTELIEEADQEIDKGNISEVKTVLNDIKENEKKIIHHGRRADAIVKGMLQHSRSSTGKKERTNINALADEYLRLSYHGLRAKDKEFSATMNTDFDQSIGNINIIPQDIGRVLLNLYNNAFYAVNEKRKLNIENYEPTVSVSTKKINDKIEIRVKDNGNGMPQKVVDKIFQPFFTTKPTGVGTGFGLSLSYDIVKAHGGEIKVETKESEFTEFVVQLPF